MYGDFVLLEQESDETVVAERLALGKTAGRDEAWLQEALFAHPEILPIRDIDPSFGPLIPLCRELRTGAGPLDIAYINQRGQLTLVECKLWRNPEARRKVVAQILDYVRAISRWSYADLQRQVSAATGIKGNVPFELAKVHYPELEEQIKESPAILIYCGDFNCDDSEFLANELFNLGHAPVLVYKGGLEDWRTHQLPVEKGKGNN